MSVSIFLAPAKLFPDLVVLKPELTFVFGVWVVFVALGELIAGLRLVVDGVMLRFMALATGGTVYSGACFSFLLLFIDVKIRHFIHRVVLQPVLFGEALFPLNELRKAKLMIISIHLH